MNELEKREPIIKRSPVEKKAHYHFYREDLRYDFCYSCAYCSMSEIEAAGIGFEIDHYLPQKMHPEYKHHYENLMWSCQSCNRFKSNFDSYGESHEKKIIRPDQENPEMHYEVNHLRLEGKTLKGEFNIDYLMLNRKQLRRIRELRERLDRSKDFIQSGIRALQKKRIDEIHKTRRALFDKLKKRAIEEKKNLEDPETFYAVIKVYGKSQLLDQDPEKGEHLKRRRKYLEKQKAII